MELGCTHGDVGLELDGLSDVSGLTVCGVAIVLDRFNSFSLKDLSFFLLVVLPALYEKLSLYNLLLLVLNILANERSISVEIRWRYDGVGRPKRF